MTIASPPVPGAQSPVPPDPLKLTPGVGAKAFAGMLPGPGVTPMSVRNWIDEGMGDGGVASKVGGEWIIHDPARALAWCEANKPEKMAELRSGATGTSQGGTREGAGRKRLGRPPVRWRTNQPDPADGGGLLNTNDPPRDGGRRAGAHNPGPHADEPPAAAGGVVGGNPDHQRKVANQADKAAEEVRKLRLANGEKTGQLLPRADVEDAVTKALVAVESAFKGLVTALVDRLATEFAIPADKRPRLVGVVDAEVTRQRVLAAKAMRGGIPQAPPPPTGGPAREDAKPTAVAVPATPGAQPPLPIAHSPLPIPPLPSEGPPDHVEAVTQAGTDDRG